MEWYYILIIIIGIILLLILTKRFFNGPRSPIQKNMSGKIVLITGASSGVGKETAIELLDQGAVVICANRSRERTHTVINKSKNKENGFFYELDLSSINSVMECVERIKKDFPNGIDILINNAGQAFTEAELTTDNIEKTIQTNHIGHFILTALLIKRLRENGKIINVSSQGHRYVKNHMIENIEKDLQFSRLNQYYKFMDFYCLTKLFNVVYSKFLAKNYPQFTSVSLHPGVVSTDIWNRTGGIFNCFVNCIKPFAYFFVKDEKMGAQTTLYCAYEDAEKLTNGAYYHDCKESIPVGIFHQTGIEKRIMNYTKDIINIHIKHTSTDLKEHLELIDKLTF